MPVTGKIPMPSWRPKFCTVLLQPEIEVLTLNFDIARNILNPKEINVFVSFLHHILPRLEAQPSERGTVPLQKLAACCLLPVNSPPPLPLHSKESSFFGLKPVPLFISLLLFLSSVFLTHPIFTAFKKGLILSFPDCPRRVVLPSQAILSKLAAQLSTFLKC